MDKQVQQAYDNFRTVVAASNMDLCDLLSLIGGFASLPNNVLAVAICSHAADYSREATLQGKGESLTYSDIISESYRRAFCDHEMAKRYNTQAVAANPEAVAALLSGAASFLVQANASPDPGQLMLALDADTDRAH